MKIKITKQRYNQIIQEELELLPRDPHQRAIEKLHRRIRAGLSDAASNVATRLYGAIPKSIKQKEDIDTPPLGHEGPSPATITKTARDYAQDAAKHDAMDSIKNIAIRLKNNFDITDVTAAGAAFKIFKYLRESHDRSSKSKLNQIIQEEVEALMREEQDLRAQAKQDITVTDAGIVKAMKDAIRLAQDQYTISLIGQTRGGGRDIPVYSDTGHESVRPSEEAMEYLINLVGIPKSMEYGVKFRPHQKRRGAKDWSEEVRLEEQLIYNMHSTKSRLNQIIQEELNNMLKETGPVNEEAIYRIILAAGFNETDPETLWNHNRAFQNAGISFEEALLTIIAPNTSRAALSQISKNIGRYKKELQDAISTAVQREAKWRNDEIGRYMQGGHRYRGERSVPDHLSDESWLANVRSEVVNVGKYFIDDTIRDIARFEA